MHVTPDVLVVVERRDRPQNNRRDEASANPGCTFFVIDVPFCQVFTYEGISTYLVITDQN